MSTIKVNTITTRSGSTVTLGESGKTITLACGASQSGFGRTGTVDWCTTAKTSPFTSVSGKGYFVNTSGGAVTITLPASPSAGDIVAIKDYAGTWGDACKAVTIGRNSSKLDGSCADSTRDTNNESLTLVYVDGTQGWKSTEEGTGFVGENFICASGGNAVVTCGNFKTHVFTSSGTFTVNSIATSAPNNTVDYLVVAGAGGSGQAGSGGGGGGAGGFRMANSLSLPAPTTSPLANPSGLPVSAQAYPITIGAGGAGATYPNPGVNSGSNGNPSVFSSITSTAGGFGGGYNDSQGDPGGSGGGGGDPDGPQPNAGGTGNTPPVSPPQGNDGGAGTGPGGSDGSQASGGGGGAGAAGSAGTFSPHAGGAGGIGSFIADAFVGPTAPSYGTPGPVSSTRYFAGGGGGTSDGTKGAGGAGGGGTATNNEGVNGTTNTGGGAAGGRCSGQGAAGGSGIIMIRYKFQ